MHARYIGGHFIQDCKLSSVCRTWSAAVHMRSGEGLPVPVPSAGPDGMKGSVRLPFVVRGGTGGG